VWRTPTSLSATSVLQAVMSRPRPCRAADSTATMASTPRIVIGELLPRNGSNRHATGIAFAPPSRGVNDKTSPRCSGRTAHRSHAMVGHEPRRGPARPRDRVPPPEVRTGEIPIFLSHGDSRKGNGQRATRGRPALPPSLDREPQGLSVGIVREERSRPVDAANVDVVAI